MPKLNYRDPRRKARIIVGEMQNRPDWLSKLGARVTIVGDCWIVDGDPNAYTRTRSTATHRLVYASIHGRIPRGYDVHHQCETPACINPAHLQLLLHADHLALHREKRQAT